MNIAYTTTVEQHTLPLQLTLKTHFFLIGSCFANEMGERMRQRGLNICVSPFGTLYNPESIATAIERICSACPFNEKDIFIHDGLYHSAMHHGSFSSVDANDTLQKINGALATGCVEFNKAEVLILTFGTSWVYTDKETMQVVSNCHKLPASRFIKHRLTTEEIVKRWSNLLSIEPLSKKKIILTVSPIRHKGDGLHGNNLSKSTLLLATEELCRIFPNCFYFPAYEILLDELRDYRWYADDLVHPSGMAADYIWQRFATTVFQEQDLNAMEEIKQYKLLCAHRPLISNPASLDALKRQQEEKRKSIENKYNIILSQP